MPRVARCLPQQACSAARTEFEITHDNSIARIEKRLESLESRILLEQEARRKQSDAPQETSGEENRRKARRLGQTAGELRPIWPIPTKT